MNSRERKLKARRKFEAKRSERIAKHLAFVEAKQIVDNFYQDEYVRLAEESYEKSRKAISGDTNGNGAIE